MPVRIVFALIGLLTAADLSPAAPVPKVALTTEQEAEFNALWDAPKASDYSWPVYFFNRLVRQPDAAVAYLERTLKPARLDEKEAKQLIADLGSQDEATWKRALRDLTVRDVRLAMTLPDAWDEAKTDEQKMRLAYVLARGGIINEPKQVGCRLEPPDRRDKKDEWRVMFVSETGTRVGHRVTGTLTARYWSDIRVAVAVASLERIGTPAARKHLKALAGGHEHADSTREAVAALERLDGTKVRPPVKLDEVWRGRFHLIAQMDTVSACLDRPKETVELFKAKLRPLKLTADGAKRLLVRLFGDDENEVLGALRELQVIDLRLEMNFEDAWKEAKTATQRCRLVDAMRLWVDTPYGEIPDDFDVDERNTHYDYTLRRIDRKWSPFFSVDLSGLWREGIDPKKPPVGVREPSGTSVGVTKDEIHPQRWIREESAVYILDAIGTDEALAIIKDMATGHPDAGPTKAAVEVLKRRKK